MAASKTKIYTAEEIEIASIARSLSHPARIRILSILSEKESIRNIDLIKILDLNKATIHGHLQKLKDSSLVNTEYCLGSYIITKNENTWERITLLQSVSY